jgi:hypothetical protein
MSEWTEEQVIGIRGVGFENEMFYLKVLVDKNGTR